MNRPTKRGRSTALLATGALLASGGFAAIGISGADASSHREAPLIAGEPQYDATDLYAFVSPDDEKSTTLVANWIPFEEPTGGPNFFAFATDARYDIKIDNNGDAKADRTFRYTFKNSYRSKNTFLYANGSVTSLNDENLNFRQKFVLTRIANGRERVLAKGRVAPSNVGEVAARAAVSGSMLSAVNTKTSVSSSAANCTVSKGSGPATSRARSRSADPWARWSSFCRTRCCMGRSGAPTAVADGGSRTRTWALDR
jgi:hypothetical protein